MVHQDNDACTLVRELDGLPLALATAGAYLDKVHNLGVLHVEQGKLDEAEQMYLRALAGYEKALGRDHTLTLNTVNHLGILYRRQGRIDEAEEMYRRALVGYEKPSGLDHARCRRLRITLASLEKDIASR
jgi:tetratricopeptide (TPR) repeat protein